MCTELMKSICVSCKIQKFLLCETASFNSITDQLFAKIVFTESMKSRVNLLLLMVQQMKQRQERIQVANVIDAAR